MKFSKLIFLLPLGALLGLTACVNNNTDTKKIEDKSSLSLSNNAKDPTNIFCGRNRKSSITRVSKSILPAGYNDLEDYQLTADFRRPSKKYPFSKALAFNDPVFGESVAVRDQNFVPGGTKVSSLWGRDSIALGGYWVYTYAIGLTTYASLTPFEANILWIPDGESFLVIQGCNGRFTVTKEVAQALLNMDDSKNAYIRFSTEGTGSAHLSEIGRETVKAWKKVYANWKPNRPAKIEEIGF